MYLLSSWPTYQQTHFCSLLYHGLPEAKFGSKVQTENGSLFTILPFSANVSGDSGLLFFEVCLLRKVSSVENPHGSQSATQWVMFARVCGYLACLNGMTFLLANLDIRLWVQERGWPSVSLLPSSQMNFPPEN